MSELTNVGKNDTKGEDTEIQKFLELRKKIYKLTQEKNLLEAQLNSLMKKVEDLYKENVFLKSLIENVKKRQQKILVVTVLFLFFINFIMAWSGKRYLNNMEIELKEHIQSSFTEEAQVGFLLKESYPDVYQLLLKQIKTNRVGEK